MIGSRRADATFVVGAVSIAHFLSHVFLLAYPPLFPLLGRAFGVSTAQLGLLVTAIYVPQLLLQLPLGAVVDRVGAKWVLVTGLAITSLSIGASGLATSYWLLLGCAFLSGIGQSVFHPADYALLGTVTTTENEGKGFSAHTFGGYAGFAAAPLAIGSVGIAIGWEVALLGAGAVGLLAAGGLALSLAPVHARGIDAAASGVDAAAGSSDDASTEPASTDPAASDAEASLASDAEASVASDAEVSADSDDGTGSADADEHGLRQLLAFVKRPDLLLVFAFYLISMMALVGLQSFTTVLAVDGYGFSESVANTLLTVHLAATAVGVIAGGPLADRSSFRWVLIGSFVLSAAGVAVLIVGRSGGTVAVTLVLLGLVGFLFGLALPSRDKFANSVADPEAVGTSFGFFFTGLSLGAVISPALLGYVIDVRSAAAAFVLVSALLVAAASVVVVATFREPSA